MHSPDYYELLGVDRYASSKVIKSAFRLRIKEIHPDTRPNSELACEQTRQILQAYKTLTDPICKAEYDTTLKIHIIPKYYEACKPEPQQFDRKIFLYSSLILLIIIITCAHIIMENRTSPYKFQVENLRLYHCEASNKCLLAPSVTEPLEWYNIQQYSYSSNNTWTTSEAEKVIERAKHKAEVNGDFNRIRFYKNILTGIHNADVIKMSI